MPLDPNIPLSVRGIEMPDPIETMAKITGIRTAQQRQQMQQMDIEGAQGAAQASQRLGALLRGPRTPTQQEIFSTGVDPAAGLEILKLISAGQAQNFKTEAEMRQSAAQFFGSLPALPDEELRQKAYQDGKKKYLALGIPAAELPEQYDPSVSDRFLRGVMPAKDQWSIDHPPAPSDYTMGRQRFSGATNQPIATAEPPAPTPPTPGSEEDYLRRYAEQRHLKVEQLSPGDVNQARSQYAAATRAPQQPPQPSYGWAKDPKTGQVRRMTDAEMREAGATPPDTAQTQNRKQARQAVMPVIDAIKELMPKINVKKGLSAKIAGGWREAVAAANYDDDVAEYVAVVEAFTPLLARAEGHTGVLTEKDFEHSMRILPMPGNSDTLATRKLARLMKILELEEPGGGGEAGAPKVDPLGIR